MAAGGWLGWRFWGRGTEHGSEPHRGAGEGGDRGNCAAPGSPGPAREPCRASTQQANAQLHMAPMAVEACSHALIALRIASGGLAGRQEAGRGPPIRFWSLARP